MHSIEVFADFPHIYIFWRCVNTIFRMRNALLAGVVSVLLSSCQLVPSQDLSDLLRETEDSLPIDVLIFGLEYVECGGDCAFLFKMEASELFEDDGIDFFRSIDEELRFKQEPMASEKFAMSHPLLDEFPEELWKEEDQTIFGNPNDHDQGGIVVEMHRLGRKKRWHIDTAEKRLPDYLVPYARRIKEITRGLREE